ncbi:MAG: toxic anion resistance protein [Firmicutes bacterium]|nr:toxic anion resistance protein [Bacillota bacterium]MBR6014589.1 toxic anion resistance protein [Bacillota bacterium]
MEKAENILMMTKDEEQAINQLAVLDKTEFSETQLAEIEKMANSIDMNDSTAIIQYGASTQKKVADFADSALGSVKTNDLGEVGNMVAKLVGELEVFNEEIEGGKGLKALFKKAQKNIVVLKAKYEKAEKSVNSIVENLDDHQVTLLKDIAILDELYEKNHEYFKEISLYIVAGKQKLEEARNVTLAELQRKAEETGAPEDAQKANDFAAQCDRFEKKIYDLELTRMVAVQMAPQIRMVQNNDNMMSEKIQSTIVNTIPLWKSQMIIALGLAHSEEALKAERAVTDVTNDLLKRNAEKLHQSTVAIAEESERGIIDIETLTHTNQELIATLDEVRDIQEKGHQKRIEAEQELGRIEGELKNKLLEVIKPQ